jgi:murein L,D-transpeptidase YafK
MYNLIPLILLLVMQTESFKQKQLSKPRVQIAYAEKESVVKKYFDDQSLKFEGFRLFLRVFKKEGIVETWVQEKGAGNFHHLRTFPFCSTSGTLGPKRKEGDLQIPEGIYHINHFNPESNFFLSLGVSYPNASDKLLSDSRTPGGAIYIHGNCVTIGCIPITDDKIKELYVLAVEARNNGQSKIPIHIFPSRLDDNGIKILTNEFGDGHRNFWLNLKPVFEDFERNKKVRDVLVNAKGEYVLN